MLEPKIYTTQELGDNSYLWVAKGERFLVDPQRDIWRFLPDAETLKITIKYVFETHLYNDYLTGALEVKAKVGDHIIVPLRKVFAVFFSFFLIAFSSAFAHNSNTQKGPVHFRWENHPKHFLGTGYPLLSIILFSELKQVLLLEVVHES
jgi:glyoxylase-like metal-dependent hydrolase (beta-lactamase superfamily II)